MARVRRFGWNISLLFVGNDLWPEVAHLGKGWRRTFNDVAKSLMLAVVCPLTVLGIVWCARRPRTVLVVAALHVITSLVVAGFFLGEYRYRVPYDPFFLVLAFEGGCALFVGARWLVQRAQGASRLSIRGNGIVSRT
jgi:hypothetical protein